MASDSEKLQHGEQQIASSNITNRLRGGRVGRVMLQGAARLAEEKIITSSGRHPSDVAGMRYRSRHRPDTNICTVYETCVGRTASRVPGRLLGARSVSPATICPSMAL